MILEFLIEIFVDFIIALLESIEVLNISVLSDAAVVLSEFCVYGSYVVGSDMLLIFGGLVLAWSLAKLSVGVGIRIWEMLPFT